MSVESLVLLVLLIGLPLLERLVRGLRARTPQPADSAGPNPPNPAPLTGPSPVAAPPLPSLHPAVERVSAGEQVRRSRTSGQAPEPALTDAGGPALRARRRFALGQPADLRRAMLLVAILGPCKALEGEAGPVPAGDVWPPR